ncbi:YSIRK-type signal peptide-containing protein [uncultured Streptococcus sp.]|nr:YSIRK-type signal peptide-containing protein [uncultured Streptococcus sp.]
MFKLSRQQKDHRYFCGNKYEKYSIKKLKVGAASVLVGTGFLFGYNLDQVNADEQKTEATTTVIPKAGDTPQSANKVEVATEPKQEKAPEVGTETPKSGTREETVPATSPQVAETNETPSTKEIPAMKETPATKEVPENKVNKVDKEIVNSSTLRDKLADLEAQLERIRGNKKQASQIQNAEKLVAEAKQYLEALDTTQKEVDAKAKEISSLTTILKSIKAEAVSKENKNQDSRNGKKMEEGTGFRIGEDTTATSTTTGVGADVVDATDTPAVTRPPYTERKVAEGLAKQIAWLDFSDTRNWSNVDIVNGNVYLKEGSIYEKEIMPNYRIKLKVKSLKPFQATEIYRKRMEANNATPEEKATFNPNATNGLINRRDNNAGVRVTAQAQDRWSEIRDNGINTNGRKTSIIAESTGANIGIQFEVSGTYKGNPVRPAVVMTDAESANRGERITFTTNGSGWQQIIDLEKNRGDARRYKPLNYYTDAYKGLPDSEGNDVNDNAIYDAGNGNKIVPKFFTNPDQETGGLGTGVFGPGLTARSYSVPVVMTKNATEVGMYVFSTGSQAAMMGVAPIDEGDAPATYGEATHTMNTRDGLTGAVVKQPYLGSERPDADTGTPKNWHGDDDTDAADEGINQLLPDSLKGSEGNIIKANVSSAGYYTLNIQAHTGGAEKAYVRSWIDFNNNGQFDSDEASDIAEITQDGDVKLHFTNKTQKDAGQLLQAGTRVRIATSREEIEKPTGLAFSGEVEDFNAKITHPPKGEKKTTIGNATIGTNVEIQRTTVHFTPKGKYIYTQDDVNAEIDTTVPPVYINNKTGEKVTLSDENTYTVRGQGTYKFTPNGKDVDVEFTPAKGFVGKAHGFTIRRQDTNRTTTDWGTSDEAVAPNVNDVLNTMDGLYVPEVRIPTVEPTPNHAESRNIQGFAQKGKPTFNVETSDTPVTASAKHPARLIDPRTNTLADSAIVDALDPNNNKVGTYKIAPETGEVTFTPNIDYKGEVKPVRVSVPVVVAHDKDDNDVTVTKEATYTPRIIPVAPTAEASTTRDVQGKAQVSRIVFDTVENNADKNQTVNFDKSPEVSNAGEHVELDKETLTLLTTSGAETNTVTTDQGEYVLDKVSKTITFTPKKTFVGQATAVRVQIKDANGTKVETTYTPTVIEVTPTGKDSATSGAQGLTQKSPIVFNQRDEEDGKTLNFDTGHERVALKPETLTLLNGTDKVKSITVPNVGTYELVDNAITFTPAPAYHGTAEGVTVQVEDENGKVVTKKYVPTVTELAVTPGDKTTKNIQGETQEGTPTFTIPTESTNVTVTSRKLVDPADQTEKDSVTLAGKGTFTIDGNGKVTFVPVPTYKEDVPPITVKATVTVTNAKNESATITSTASYKPIIVAAEIDKAPATSTNLQGLVQTGTPTFTPKTIEVDGVQKTISVQANSYKLVKDGAESESLPAYKAGTSEQIGTYTINPATGQVTFTPTDKTYTGAVAPVDVQATGSNGVKVQTTYTPSITPVTPTKEPSATTDVQGKKQVSRIVLDTVETDTDKDKTVNFNKGAERGNNGEQVELDPNTLTLLNDAGAEVPTLTTNDGKYELDKTNRTITFTPNKNFVGPATPVKVQIKDVNGTKVETTYTPTVTDVTMTSVDKESSAPQGKTQTGTPTFTVSTPDVRITGYKLLNPTGNTPVEGNEIEVPDQGTYRINPTTGEVTFIPKPGFTGPATGITVQATDENGETKDAKYKPTVTALTITPQPVTTTNIQGETQEGTPTFPVPAESNNVTVTSRKLVDPADQTEKDRVTVEGKGTFTIDGNGKVTFTPLPTYKGDVDPITVKATVTITNDKNESTTIPSTTTYKPIIVSAEIDKEPATSTNLQGFVQTGTPAFKPKTVDVDGTPKTISVQANSYKLVKDGVENTTLPAYKAGTRDQIGTYTIDSATGQVTFTPSDKTYSGEVAPVSVQATGSNGVKVETTYTPIITPVTPTAEKSATSDVQGKKQTSSILLDTPENSVDKDKTVNFNKGSQVGANGERVELDANTLTLLDGTTEVTSLTTNDGEYVLDKASKTITFTPKKTFVGTATPVKVQIKDANGTKVETTYTPTVTDITMKGDPATTSAPQGQTQTGTPTFTISSPEVRITGYKLLNPNGNTPVEGNEIEVPDQGTYRINPANGQVTFIPKPGFTGPATGISVQATDENGETAEAKYTPTVNALAVTPGDKTTTNIQGVTQEETPTFTIPTESTNATVTSRKLVDPADQTEKDSVTLAGKGTFTIDGNGKVTFVPVPTYKEDVPPITVKATVTVTNAKNESATITSTASYKPIIVAAEIDKAPATSTNLQGLVQTGTPTFTPKTIEVDGVQKTISVQANSYKLVKDGAESESLPAYKAGTSEQIGTYTINPATGQVTFTPTDKTYTGAVAPVDVQATGSNGVKVQTTYTPSITPVTPTKEPSATTDVQGKKQVSRIVLDTVETDTDKDKTVNFNKGAERGNNGEQVELDPNTLTLLNDAGAEVPTLTTNDGKYELDKTNRTITFTPNKNFVGPATPVKVQIKDVNGTKVETTYTPTVTDVTMTSVDKESSAPQGKTQTGTPTFTVSTPDVRITGYKLLNPTGNTPVEGNEIEVPDQGTYRINPTTGEVTFIPKPGFTGPATGITVQATDENGETKDAKYKPTVTALTITPQPVTTTNIQGETQEGTPTFPVPAESNNVTVTSRKLVDPADQTEKDRVTVEGKGTFTIDGNGKVTFTPLPTYKGDVDPITVKATVTITNDKNESTTIPSTTTYKPIIVSAEIDKEPATSTNLQGFVQTGTPAFKPKTVDVDGTPKTISVQANSYKLVKDGVENTTLPAYKAGTREQIGTYTIDSATGQVTFTPSDKTYSGEVAPVSVQATGSNGVKVETTYTPIITPVTPTAEKSATSDVQGKKQTSSILLDTPENSVDKDKTVNFNKGSQVGANGERVELDASTLTLLDGTNEVTSLTTNDGEYVLDKASKTITFTPKKTFVGTATAVRVQIKDANGTKVETTYTPTVTEVTPTGKDSATTGLQGFAQKSPIVFNQKDEEDGKTVNFDTGNEKVALKPDTLTLLNGNEKVKTITVPDVGTYELKDNVITFTPLPSYHGTPEGVTVQIEDENGKPVTKKYVPTVTQVTPTGTNTTSSGLQGKVQTGKPVFNGGVPEVPMDDEVPATLEGADQDGKVVIAGKGTYTVAKDGTVTFTPDKNFVGDAPAVTVKRVDKNGTIATATYTPTVTDVTMSSVDKTSEAPQGKTQTGTPEFSISTSSVRITEYKLVDPTNNKPVEEVEVENQGTYSIDKATGEVTFVPKPGFTGPTTGITVRATDENGETKDATYTPSVTPLKVTPENKSTTNIQGLPQEATPTFKLPKGVTNAVVTERKLIDPITKSLTNSVTVDGKGTFTINANGKVTFTPVPSYVGDVPAIEVQGTITVLNENNDSTTMTSKASYKPIIVPIELEKTPAESTNVQGLVQKGTPTFTPQSVDVNGVEKTVTVKPNSYKLVKDETETDTIPAYKKDTQEVIGKYTIDSQTGEVTFTPTDKTYTGEVEPATVQATGSNNVKVQTTYTPMIKPVKPVGTNAGSEGIQGAPQSGTPSFKSGNENIPMTVSATNPAKLVDPANNQPIEATEIDAKNAAGERVGLYTINPATGEVTFTPEPGFSGTPVPATVQAKDGNGTPTTATYTPVVKAAVPSGDNQVTSDIQGAVQTATPVFTPGKNTVNNQEVSVPFEATSKAKLIDPSKTGDEREVTTLVVENQGTYTIDDNGVVTFTPLPTFKGEATAVSIERKDKNGTVATATYKPNVVGVTPSATEATTTKVQGATQETPVTFTPGKATIGTAEKSVPMDPNAYKLLGGQEGKTPLDTVPAMSEDGTKEVGTYTIKVVDGKPVVTFTPTDKTYAGKLKPVTVQGKDTNGTEATTTYTPVITPIVPTAENGTSEGPQGVEQTGSVTFKPGKEPGTENTPVAIDKTKMTLLGTDGTTPVESLTVSKDGKVIGTYTLVKDPSGLPTGEVKFTPTDKSFVGEVPAATVQVKDANGTPATATYTPTFTEVNPTSKPSETTGFQGLPQTSRVVLDEKDEADNTTVNFDKGNDKVALVPSTLTLVNADGAKVTSVTVPNEGTYELNNGVITFTPLPTFHGKASGVSVQAEDVNGKVAKTTYTPTVTEVRPVGTNAGSEGIQGAPQSGTPSFKSGNENIPMTVSATNPAKLVVDGQPVADTTIPAKDDQGQQVGTYTIEPATGKVTFTPNPGFSGTPVPATVQAKDGNGTPTTATYTPVVKAAVPSGDNQVTSDIQGAVQTATPVFTPGKNTVNNQEVSVPFEATSKAKLIDPSKTGDEREVTTLVVENQGTYTIDDNGVVTFTPLPTFKGEATAVSIERKDKNGTVATATYKPNVVGVTPSATEATTTKVQGATQETPVTFTPGKATIGTAEKSVPMDPNAYKLLGGQEGKTPLDTVPAMSEDGTKEVGTYTIKVVDGKPVVTFTPTDKTYAGKLKPVTVQGKDTNGTEATTTYTPVITPIVPTAENGTSEGPQGVEQTGSVTFKPGKEPGTENTPVAIDKTKMTLLGTDGTTPVESLTVSKDGKVIGTYTLVKDPSGLPTGEVKFTPTDKSFVGEVPAATVQVKDANGTPATATYTPTFTEVNPTGKDSATTGLQGFAQKSPIVFNQKDEEDKTTVNFDTGHEKVTFKEDTLTLVNAAGDKVTTVTVPDVGTYELKDGVITFTPLKTFKGKPEGVTVQVEDANGKVVKQKYVPNVVEVLPTGKDTTSTGLQGKVQTGTPVFTPGAPEVPMDDESPATFEDGNITKTVDKVGTYTVAKDGTVTFTPDKDFSGEAPEVTVKRVDKNGTSVTAKYKPTVEKVTPTGKDTTSTGLQGKVQTGTPVFTPGAPEVPMDDESPATFEDGNITKTVDKVGTYTVAKDGTVTFTPDKDFSGEAPEVTVKRVDKNGTSVTAKYKPTVTKVTPTGKDTTSTGLQGKVQTGTPVFTPGAPEVPMDDESPATFEDGNITKTVDKVGTYTVAKDGTVTFTPDKDFSGEAPEVTVKRVDKNGTSVTAKYKPTVTKVTPTGKDTTSTGLQGKVQTGTPVFTPGNPEVPMDDESPATFDNGQISKKVDKVGTYTVAKDGTVTFTPDKDFSGEAPEVTVKRVDKNGTSVTAKYKPTVEKVTPTGKDTTSTGLQGKVQTGTPVFTPGNPEVPMDDESPATFDNGQISKKVDKVGTYTVAKDGTVTFTPDKDFSGEAPEVTVKRVDKNGTSVTAKYKPTVEKVTPTGKDTTSTGLQGKVQTGTPVFTPGNPEVPMDDESPATFDNGQISKKVDKVGTYTVAKDGTVTFTPDKDFSGEAPEVTVKRVDKNGTAVTAKYKPIVAKVLPTGEGSETEGAKGKPQTSAVIFDKKDEDKSTVNFNKGDETVALNPSTLTLVDKNGNPSTEVKVPGEGTYTLANNVITFTPEKDFAGKATGVTVQVKDINGTSIEKTYTPTVRAVTTFVDPSGNPITVDKNNKPVESEVDGSKQPPKDIYGYKFVRTETDNKGNTKHIYEQAEGQSVKVTYVSTTGETLRDSQTVETKDKFIGTDYDASIEALKLERIEKDGKVYLLKERKADSATETGKLSDKEQTVTYVYEEVQEPASNQKYGNVVVVYKDKFGRPISGTTESGKEVASTEIDTPSSPINTEYDTTDHKPQTITTKDGKKYKLIKVLKTSDAEKSGVKARTSVITYVYEMLGNTAEYPEAHIGLVLVNYLDEEGTPISGKTPEGKVVPNIVVDTEADLVGKDYDTTDHKVSTIIVENGDVYELLKVSEASVEKGKLTEGATNVNYIYHKVVTTFVDENGKEIKTPEKGRTDKKDIPEYTFKETKKDANGNTVYVYTKKSSSTPVTPTPTPSTPSKEKETLYIDANGKPLQPAKKGQHPQDNIPGYEFVGTETDANGNVRHLYRKIQSTIPVEPVQPTAPTMPEQPAQPEVPTSPAQPVQPTEVKEVEAKRELPNTGTEDHASLAALGLLGALSGFGLLASKKKED